MIYHFKQAAHLAGKDYMKGNHDVPEAAEEDPFFLKLVGAGLIVEPEAVREVSPESPHERSKRLYDRLVNKKEKKVKAAPANKDEAFAKQKEDAQAAAKAGVAAPEESAEEDSDEKVEKKSSKADKSEKSEKKHGGR